MCQNHFRILVGLSFPRATPVAPGSHSVSWRRAPGSGSVFGYAAVGPRAPGARRRAQGARRSENGPVLGPENDPYIPATEERSVTVAVGFSLTLLPRARCNVRRFLFALADGAWKGQRSPDGPNGFYSRGRRTCKPLGRSWVLRHGPVVVTGHSWSWLCARGCQCSRQLPWLTGARVLGAGCG